MRTVYRAAASAVRATAFVALSASITGAAIAADWGSTNIYANEFAASFGVPGKPSASPINSYTGSTDIWGPDGFLKSFGPAARDARPTKLCGSGSTDIYGVDGFRVSFGPPASRESIDLAQACQRLLR